jgi:N-sulfoglucosamine sulfohydrolase
MLGTSLLLFFFAIPFAGGQTRPSPPTPASRPNILFCIADDQSAAHVGAAGDPVVHTPAFDQVARRGVRFTCAFADAPSCTPSRGAILTGRHIWQLEEGGNLHSTLPARFDVYPELLRQQGYVIGYSGKPWGPGKIEPGGRTENPAGPRFKDFKTFLAQAPQGHPFCFWLGSFYPHRPYPEGSGAKAGLKAEDVPVPPQLPDSPVVRSDMLDYYLAIQKFDRLVMEALEALDAAGLRQNTLVVVTSDNGMPFPRGKAELYDLGTHMPLAVSWPTRVASGRTIEDMVVLSDLAPTFLEAAGLKPPAALTGKSLLPVLLSSQSGIVEKNRDAVFFAKERHDGCRKGGKGYPTRGIRTRDFLYIRNFEPDRWPVGNPDPAACSRALPYGDVDPSPTKQLLLDHPDLYPVYFQRAFAKRPGEELYDLKKDPAQWNNVADSTQYAKVKERLRNRLMDYLRTTGDPRALGKPALWDYYPYYGKIVTPGWKVDEMP